MIQLAYVSQANESLGPDDVFSIIEVSSRNNARDGLTGFLIYSNGKFLQIVEGEADQVNALMERLRNDRRHTLTRLIFRHEIEERSFPSWRMRRVKNREDFYSLPSGIATISTEVKLVVSQFFDACQSEGIAA